MRKNRNILLALLGSLFLHGGFAAAGHFMRPGPETVTAKEEAPTIELAPMPPVEPDKPETVENDETPPPETAELPPPMIADTPSVQMDSPFQQQIQPPPTNVNRPSGNIIAIPKGRAGAGDKKTIVDFATLDQKPVVTYAAKPVHPFELQRARISGSATVQFIVDSTGAVSDVNVIDATHTPFGPAAAKAISQYKLRPGKKNGSVVSTRMQLTIHFKLAQTP